MSIKSTPAWAMASATISVVDGAGAGLAAFVDLVAIFLDVIFTTVGMIASGFGAVFYLSDEYGCRHGVHWYQRGFG